MKETAPVDGQSETSEKSRKGVRWKGVAVTLYLDSFFLLNAGMNLWLLFLVKRFLKLRTRPGRMAAAAAAGGAGACGVLALAVWLWQEGGGQGRFWPPLVSGGVRLVVWGMGLGCLMIRLAFGRAGWRETGKRLAVLWMAAAFTGGLLSAGYGLSGGLWKYDLTQVWNHGLTLRPESPRGPDGTGELLVFVLAVAGISLAAAGCWNLLQWRIHEKQFICQALVSQGGKTIQVQALWDTGNQLFEPYTHHPVHVITRSACQRLCGTVSGVIFVPFQAVGTRSGILPALRVESMDIIKEGKTVKHYEHPWLAVSEEALSPCNQYEMLLHGEEGL